MQEVPTPRTKHPAAPMMRTNGVVEGSDNQLVLKLPLANASFFFAMKVLVPVDCNRRCEILWCGNETIKKQ